MNETKIVCRSHIFEHFEKQGVKIEYESYESKIFPSLSEE